MPHNKTYDSITNTVFNTPMVRLRRLVPPEHATVYAKCEFFNPMASVKDRIAEAMIAAAEREGRLTPETHIIEPTSGNTGIALAFVCACRGYRLTLTMPESMSIERRKILKIFGAELVLTPAEQGMAGAIAKAEELVAQNPNSFMPQQFKNPANPQIHRETTAQEIWNDSDGRIGILVAGVGTGGTLTGCGEVLKAKNKDLKVVAVEPKDSPVLSGGKSGPHKIQGIGAGFVPDVLNVEIIDDVIQVANENAIETARQLALKEGILSGISGGANVWAAVQLSHRQENEGKVIVTFVCDTGERYISTEMYG